MIAPSLFAPSRGGALAAFVARTVVGGLFILTGLAKLMAIDRFIEEVRKYDMLPLAMSNSVAYILPWLELIAGALLVCCLWRREARWVIVTMLAIFTAAKIYAYARGLHIECGCGGQIAFLKKIFDLPQGIFTNLVLLGILAVDSWAERRDSATAAPGLDSSADTVCCLSDEEFRDAPTG